MATTRSIRLFYIKYPVMTDPTVRKRRLSSDSDTAVYNTADRRWIGAVLDCGYWRPCLRLTSV